MAIATTGTSSPSVLSAALKAVPPPRGNYDDCLHRPYLFCREGGMQKTLQTLLKLPRYGNTAVIIGSGFGGLDMVCQRGLLAQGWQMPIENVVIVDRSIRIQKLWETHLLVMIKKCPDRDAFCSSLFKKLSDKTMVAEWFSGEKREAQRTQVELMQVMKTLETAKQRAHDFQGMFKSIFTQAFEGTPQKSLFADVDVSNTNSWLSSDERYKFVQIFLPLFDSHFCCVLANTAKRSIFAECIKDFSAQPQHC